MGKKGITILELVIAASVGALAVYIFSNVISGETRTSGRITAKGDLELTLRTAEKFIRRLGRVATTCSKTAPAVLQCDVDFGTGTATKVQFIMNPTNTALLYQQQLAPPAWTTIQTYADITGFTVCDGADMDTSTAPPGVCPILPAGINVWGPNSVKGGLTSYTFFRYQLTGQSSQVNAENSVTQVRSAFYVRNPVLLNPAPPSPIIYQFGG